MTPTGALGEFFGMPVRVTVGVPPGEFWMALGEVLVGPRRARRGPFRRWRQHRMNEKAVSELVEKLRRSGGHPGGQSTTP